MRTTYASCVVMIAIAISGCASDSDEMGITNRHQPGPAMGQAVGAGVGFIGGNVAGAVVGFGEGVAGGASVPFDNTTRVVRRWRTETTADGRTIQVPDDVVVDRYGRPLNAQCNGAAPNTRLATPKDQ